MKIEAELNLSTPGTSVSNERMFSNADQVVADVVPTFGKKKKI